MTHLEAISNEIGITEIDLLKYANLLLTSIANDGINISSLTEEQFTDIVFAYVESENKKYNKFCDRFHLNAEAKNAFTETVYEFLGK